MIGATISRYEITEKLGEGGMGVVYKAQDTKLERPVALKFLAAHLVSNEEAKKRFMREAKAAAALDHPNICTLYEIDEANGHTFMAMAYLEGRTLEERISEGPLPIEEALDIGTQVAKGLQKAHGKGIYHRDIKPSNLVLVDEGPKERLVKIMDFGLAHLADQSKLTQKDTALGTPAYMSPEQAQGVPVDHRTDIWSLGVVLYEMVVAQMPFKGEYQQAVFYTILNEDYEPLTGLRTGVPMDLEFIVSKCLAKNGGQRYQSAGDLIVDLTNLGQKLAAKKSATVRKAAATHIASASRPAQEPAAGPGAGAAVVMTGNPAGRTQLPTEPGPTMKAREPEPSTPESNTESRVERARPGDSPAAAQRATAGAVRHGTAGHRTASARQRLPWIVAGAPTAAALAFALLFFTAETQAPARSIVSAILPPEGVSRIDDLALSPDGRWVVYMSDESGRFEIYAAPFPNATGKVQVSAGGGEYPLWRGDGKEIFYRTDDGVIMAADVEAAGERFRAGAPRRLFQVRLPAEGGYRRKYDVTADGKKFLVIELAEGGAKPVVMLDSNWPSRLR